MGLRSLGLADLGAGLCKRNSVLNVALFLNCPNHTTIVSYDVVTTWNVGLDVSLLYSICAPNDNENCGRSDRRLTRPASASAACQALAAGRLYRRTPAQGHSWDNERKWCLLLRGRAPMAGKLPPLWDSDCDYDRPTANDSGLSGLSSPTRMLWPNAGRKKNDLAVDLCRPTFSTTSVVACINITD